MDMGIVNAFLLHKDIAKGKEQVPLTQKAFRETLAVELAELGSHLSPGPSSFSQTTGSHRLVHINGNSTAGRIKCRHSGAKTALNCSSCDVA